VPWHVPFGRCAGRGGRRILVSTRDEEVTDVGNGGSAPEAPGRLDGDPEDRAGVVAEAAGLMGRIADLAGESDRRRQAAGRPAGSLPTVPPRTIRISLAHEWMPRV
jgi:hypothetical protein